MKRQLHLNLFIHGRGHHEASWRHPASSPLPLTDMVATFDWTGGNGQPCSVTAQFDFDFIYTGLQQKNLMTVTDHNRSATAVKSTCPFNAQLSTDTSAHLSLTSESQLDVILSDGSVTDFQKTTKGLTFPRPRFTARGVFGQHVSGWGS
jgi:hypothetical protein